MTEKKHSILNFNIFQISNVYGFFLFILFYFFTVCFYKLLIFFIYRYIFEANGKLNFIYLCFFNMKKVSNRISTFFFLRFSLFFNALLQAEFYIFGNVVDNISFYYYYYYFIKYKYLHRKSMTYFNQHCIFLYIFLRPVW